MVEKIGHGRYGEVWLATWRGERVAVKVKKCSKKFKNERFLEIFKNILLKLYDFFLISNFWFVKSCCNWK